MKLLCAVLVALSTSFLIVGPTHAIGNGPSDDWDHDQIKNDVDPCQYDSYLQDYHEQCLKSAGLKMPSYNIDDEQAAANWEIFKEDPTRWEDDAAGLYAFLNPTTPNDRGYYNAQIKTCSDLNDWRFEMLTTALDLETRRMQFKRFFRVMVWVYGVLGGPVSAMMIRQLGRMMDAEFRSQVRKYTEYADSGVTAYFELCSRKCGEHRH